MAQRSIEILIGRLITDEAFRNAFRRNRAQTLQAFLETGHELTAPEVAAVFATPAALWSQVAEGIDPRLQKAQLTKEDQ